MTNLLSSGAEWLAGQLKAHASSQVAYLVDGAAVSADGSGTVAATLGNSRHEVPDSEGFLVEIQVRDWLIQAADLADGGEQIEPELGHLIRYTVRGQVHTYEVTAPAAGRPVWQWSDRDFTRRRIHTVLRGVEDV